MQVPRHIEHYKRHLSISYSSSLHQRIFSYVVAPAIFLIIVFFVISKFGLSVTNGVSDITWGFLIFGAAKSFIRLTIAYIISLFFAIPLAILINHSRKAESFLLPLFDVVQSVPVLAFFPVVVLLFVHYGLYNAAAIFILLLTMMWSIVFSVVGGLRSVPKDVKAVGKIFGLTEFQTITKILLPSVVPYLVTGSLLAWASGWNIVIVAEVLHTYIPGATSSSDLVGIGSALVSTAASGNQASFFMALTVLVVFVGLLNFFVWQKLLKYAERFKYE